MKDDRGYNNPGPVNVTGDVRASAPGSHASKSDDQLLLDYVQNRDVPCPLCGYNLRKLTVPRCPECGKALKLSVGLAEPFMKAWIACASTACLSAGIGVFIVIGLSIEGLPDFASVLEAITCFSFVAMIPVASVILMGRRWFLRRSYESQILLAIIVVASVILEFALLAIWMD